LFGSPCAEPSVQPSSCTPSPPVWREVERGGAISRKRRFPCPRRRRRRHPLLALVTGILARRSTKMKAFWIAERARHPFPPFSLGGWGGGRPRRQGGRAGGPLRSAIALGNKPERTPPHGIMDFLSKLYRLRKPASFSCSQRPHRHGGLGMIGSARRRSGQGPETYHEYAQVVSCEFGMKELKHTHAHAQPLGRSLRLHKSSSAPFSSSFSSSSSHGEAQPPFQNLNR